MSTSVNLTTPVGRLVEGSLYKGNTTDAEGNALVVKNGPNKGQPRVEFYFALAIPKGQGETHWAQTAWGRQIWDLGNALFPNVAQSPKFAWKITDGDSTIPNTKGRKPCEREGFPGHWVLRFSSGFAPRIFRQEGGQFVQMIEPDAVKLGYYIQVNGNIDGNGSSQQPGVFLNHSMVCFSGYGTEIVVGPDASSAGFGAAPLPAGASATPLASSVPLPAVGGVPGAVPAPLIPSPGVPGVPVPVPAVPTPAPAPVPVPTPAAPGRQLTAAANGATYEQLIANGWTDAALVQNGLMLAPAVAAVPTPLPPGGSVPAVPAVAPIAVAPNPQFAQVPAPAPVPVPVPTPAAPVRQLTAAANGATYEQLIANGWTDAALVQNGLMLA
jgi:hypothetical protein